jgi:hypothetical protein
MADRWLVQNPLAAWRVYDGEAFIISPRDSTLHALNPVGTLVWEAADGQTRVGTIVDRICREFDVEPDRAARDLETFVGELCQRGLLTVRDAPGGEP